MRQKRSTARVASNHHYSKAGRAAPGTLWAARDDQTWPGSSRQVLDVDDAPERSRFRNEPAMVSDIELSQFAMWLNSTEGADAQAGIEIQCTY